MMLLEDWACVSDSLARDFKFAPEDSFCHWKTIVGLDLQNLVNQVQYLSKFGLIWPKLGHFGQIFRFWARNFKLAPRELYWNWKTTIGLDFRNLAYQAKNLAWFGPNLSIWANSLVFESQTSYLHKRSLIAIEKGSWGYIFKIWSTKPKNWPNLAQMTPKFDYLDKSISFLATYFIFALEEPPYYWKTTHELDFQNWANQS